MIINIHSPPSHIAIIIGVLFSGMRVINWLPGGLPLKSDALSYLFSGYHTSIGYPAFLYSFDPKGPGVQFISAAIHFLAPNNTVAAGSAILMGATGTILATGFAADTLDNLDTPPLLSIAGAVAAWGVLPFGIHFITGFSMKSVISFIPVGISSLIIYNRYITATGIAAVSAIFWQPTIGLLFITLIFSLYRIRNPWRYLLVSILIIFCLVLIITGPFILWGSGSQLVVQTIIAPIVTGSENVARSWVSILTVYRGAIPLAATAYIGLAITIWKSRMSKRIRPLMAVGIWTLIIMPILSQRGYLDIIVYAPLIGVFATIAVYTASDFLGSIKKAPPILFAGIVITILGESSILLAMHTLPDVAAQQNLWEISISLPAIGIGYTIVVYILSKFYFVEPMPPIVVAGGIIILTGLALWVSLPYPSRLVGNPSSAAWAYLDGEVPIGCHADIRKLEQIWIEIVGGADRQRCMTIKETLDVLLNR